MAAVHAKGTTVIDNAAREPEIADLCDFLVAMGADIEGIGIVDAASSTASSPAHCAPCRTRRSSPTASRPPPTSPRSPSAGGEIVLRGARREHMEMLLRAFRDMGVDDRRRPTTGCVVAAPRTAALDRRRHAAVPGHRHRLQAADRHDAGGRRRRRHRHREPLPGPVPVRRGAAAARRRHPHRRPPRRRARCARGSAGAPVRAPDIRAGAALVVAGLAAEGETTITGVHHIDRGYDDLVGRLRRVGADIERVRGASVIRVGAPAVNDQRPSPSRSGSSSCSTTSGLGPSTRRLASASRRDDDDDRAGDEQHLVPAALVGEHSAPDRMGSARP